MHKIGELFKYNCFFSTAILYLLSKMKIIDKNIVVESIRRKKAKKLFKKYKYVIDRSKNNNNYTDSYEKKIWTCWFQGEENAPKIVKKCLNSIRKNASDWEVIVITKSNINEYVDLPKNLLDKWESGKISNTHFSDILRCALLIQHGGLWMDSTCYLSGSIPKYVSNGEMFCFKHKYRNEDTIEFASWFLFSKRNNPLLKMVFDLETEYWKKNNKLADYFLFHIFIYIAKGYYKKIWNFTPNLSDVYPHELNRLFNDKFDRDLYDITIKNSFVHKMSYKTTIKEKGSFHEYFLKEEL